MIFGRLNSPGLSLKGGPGSYWNHPLTLKKRFTRRSKCVIIFVYMKNDSAFNLKWRLLSTRVGINQ
ncbi:hypothetical protein TRIP_C60147 [Candidatus Zixiibacteriota bacterium]|nr:hypothetical protein TRIP_C60147 [candidate division Zixibacteria bacterium]